MGEGGYLYCKGATTVPFQYEHCILKYDGCGVEWHAIDKDTICQYTGLTDKADNKAFENSIIKLISENVFGVVRFGEYKSPFDNEETSHIGFYVDWENDDRCKFWRKDLGYWLNVDTVIVGNIFDTQELLGGEQ